MEKFLVNGGAKLNGTVVVPRAKNSFLPIMASTILCDEKIVLKDYPNYLDTFNMCKILKFLGKKVSFQNGDLIIEKGKRPNTFVPEHLAKKLRSSIFTLGALLGKHKKAKISMPGGCQIGQRPIDLHILGLKTLGVEFKHTKNFLICKAKNMHSGKIKLKFPSVGATENLIMASVLLKGKTVILNAAKEPEIVDLANFLNQMGAKIKGAGTKKIVIVGVEKLHETTFSPIPDRIFAGTIMIACAMTGGKVTLKNCNPNHLKKISKILKESGCKLKILKTEIIIESTGKIVARKTVKTAPYPGFATDLQSQVLAFFCVCAGKSKLVEKVFENRFQTALELKKMQANIKIKNNVAVVCGGNLVAATVKAPDLRGGAALVLAGLVAKGQTTVENVFHIDRGYFCLEKTLQKLGANIKRVT